MRIVTDTTHPTFVTSVSGRLDSAAAAEFERQVQEVLAKSPEKLVFDFSELSYISSAGLRVVLDAGRTMRMHGGDLLITGLDGMAREIFELSGFLALFRQVASAHDADARV
uniref:STAS domain-containing protein n=1 Tax=Pandoraea pnomenusa TaxID=93220 RepID=UPI0003C75B6F|nr:STAS domain-containing protein [Pandoraea pnomenusa]